ncbi:S-adenosyl-L-methionine-dependent methyltransferase [Lasiodiplodia theobromae]|nr:S-adenosyl-L-methionine-dependent methyltransferase [Lasiodiplodia theobromae]
MSTPPQAVSPLNRSPRGGAKKSASRSPKSAPRSPVSPIADLAAPIEVADDVDESDGGTLSDTSSLDGSVSLTSSLRAHVFENGRRYHKYLDGQYNFPNDEKAQEREDMKHAIVVAAMDEKLHFAPIGPNPQYCLDLGTGTGAWAVEMGEAYPSAAVEGVDLSPIQPTWVPPNVKFTVDDIEAPWLHPADHFDYVHARHGVEAFKDYPAVLKQAYKHLRPGGWMELQEFEYMPYADDDSMPPNYALREMLELVTAGLRTMSIDLRRARPSSSSSPSPSSLDAALAAAGFEDVSVRQIKVPIGAWPKDAFLRNLGLCWQANIAEGLQGITLRPLGRGLGWETERIEVFLAEVRRALADRAVHAYMNLFVFCGRKPVGEEGGE